MTGSPLIDDPTVAVFLVCERGSDRIAGFISINNIVQGAFHCGAIGYGAFAHAAGRGLMGEGQDAPRWELSPRRRGLDITGVAFAEA